MGFFSRLFGKKNYEEELKEKCSDMMEKDKIEEEVSNYAKKRDNSKFQFKVEDIFTITGRGVVATGRVISGTINYGDIVTINNIQATVVGIESFRKTVNSANAGDSVGILLNGITRDQVQRGDFIYK